MRLSFCCAAVLLLLLCGGARCQPDRVLLSGVSALTFVEGRATRARRNSSRPQLQCVGGSAKGETKLYPGSIRCVNTGFTESGVLWECRPMSSLHKSVELGKMTVACEGFSYPEDKFILKDSCSLEYELNFTEHGQKSSPGAGCGRRNETAADCGFAGTRDGESSRYPSLFLTLWEPLIIAVFIGVLFNVRRAITN
mmetsp:Transcript_8230/g.24744  ORF Transcript_8230/g.24744 Transcript_8230/m.24744 type:complete len:196 (-) Transcript_8230:33-620(-)